MEKIRIGILAPSEIAFRRFLPSLLQTDKFEYVGVAIASVNEWFGINDEKNISVIENERKKAMNFVNTYGGEIFEGYQRFLESKLIDAIYIPLPPNLHFFWAKFALENKIHVLVEKPSTTSLKETQELISIAKINKLALHENYMFVYHSQISYIKELMKMNTLGQLRLISINFGFPFREKSDFRYNKSLGGGALLDCGGYTLKLAKLFLGDSVFLKEASLGYIPGIEVDMYGSATLSNVSGLIVNVSFGMDNAYKCDLDIWGSKGKLYTNRILTAPDEFTPTLFLNINGIDKQIVLESDTAFRKSIEYFHDCIIGDANRNDNYNEILVQSNLVEKFINVTGGK